MGIACCCAVERDVSKENLPESGNAPIKFVTAEKTVEQNATPDDVLFEE